MVAADGTIDWWCPLRYDAPAVFTRLLEPLGACLRIAPGAGPPVLGVQRYVEGTLVLRTLIPGRDSLLEVTDVMVPQGTGSLIRRVRVLRGPAEVVLDVVPGPTAQTVAVWSEGMAFDGTVVRWGHPMTVVTAPPPAPERPRRRRVCTGSVILDTGAELVVSVEPAGGGVGPLSPDGARRAEERTALHWRRVAEGISLPGRYTAAAAHSALVVEALSGIAGAPVTSPVTSLPRVVGGERNSDGRLVEPVTAAAWAMTAAAVGLHEASDAALSWLMEALDHEAPLPAALAPDASGAPPRRELSWPGWRRSQPVVTGSDSAERTTTEATAAAVAAAATLAEHGTGTSARSHWGRVITHADWLAEHWADQEASVWDVGGPRRSWPSARLVTRHALALAAEQGRRRNPLDLDAAGWHVAVRDIERWLAGAGVGDGAVLRSGGTGPTGAGDAGHEPPADAALARVAWLGPWPPVSEVAVATLTHLGRRLGDGPWLRPYPPDLDDGMGGSEPASVVATLWLARAWAATGRWEEAHERMEAVLALGGPLALLSGSVDAVGGAPLGNRPHAGAHLAFIAAALALAQAPD